MRDAPTQIAPGFKRADPATLNGHPLRGSLKLRQQRETLAEADFELKRTRTVVIRDTLISLMGAVSAMVPLVVAFQSVMGA